MIDLALDPTETRPERRQDAPRARGRGLRFVLLGLAGTGALAGFSVAASTLMAGLAAPPPVKFAPPTRAAEWPELKDGLPALAETAPVKPRSDAARAEPETPALRMATLSDPPVSPPPPARIQPEPARPMALSAPEAPTKRIPTPTPVAPIGPARQAPLLPPARSAALVPPRAAETVRAREVVETASKPAAPAVVTAPPAGPAEKSPRKAVAARKAPAPAQAATKPSDAPMPAATVAEAEETEVLGIKLPSLAPAGRKLKESVDALGDAVKSVF